MKLLLSIIVFFLIFCVNADKNNIEWQREYKNKASVKIDKIRKRNEPGCERLGNVYGYCEWVVVINVINNSNRPLKKFCSYIKVNQRKFDFCYGNKNKILLKKKNEKNIILNLHELLKFPNNFDRPVVTLSNEEFIF
ncbi:MAG: hypothetical protein CMP24_02700 [Rickettsiales bacterium]|nr:hypothetical protein [Rickettsiales bacterium]|tara:strand:- start:296 stop:706 length:411 start_codon:yes stop_codon:yes gene_type:complete